MSFIGKYHDRLAARRVYWVKPVSVAFRIGTPWFGGIRWRVPRLDRISWGDLQHERSPTLLAIADRMEGTIALLREIKEALDDGRFTEGGDGEQWLDERLDALHGIENAREEVR